MARVLCLLAVTNVAVGKTMLLECTVAGAVTVLHSGPSSEFDKPATKLKPATVRVQIDETAKALFIEVDGPSDYAVLLSSAPRANKAVRASIADPSIYMLWTVREAAPASYEERITINRMTGTIAVEQTFTNPSFTQRTTYNGTCTKMKTPGAKF
jgi:hypothetical protein